VRRSRVVSRGSRKGSADPDHNRVDCPTQDGERPFATLPIADPHTGAVGGGGTAVQSGRDFQMTNGAPTPYRGEPGYVCIFRPRFRCTPVRLQCPAWRKRSAAGPSRFGFGIGDAINHPGNPAGINASLQGPVTAGVIAGSSVTTAVGGPWPSPGLRERDDFRVRPTRVGR